PRGEPLRDLRGGARLLMGQLRVLMQVAVERLLILPDGLVGLQDVYDGAHGSAPSGCRPASSATIRPGRRQREVSGEPARAWGMRQWKCSESTRNRNTMVAARKVDSARGIGENQGHAVSAAPRNAGTAYRQEGVDHCGSHL